MRILPVSGILFGILTIIFSGCAHTEMKNPAQPEPVYIEPTEEGTLVASGCTEATNQIFIRAGVSFKKIPN